MDNNGEDGACFDYMGWTVRIVHVKPAPELGDDDVYAGFGAHLTNIATGEKWPRSAFERKIVTDDAPDFSGFGSASDVVEAVRRVLALQAALARGAALPSPSVAVWNPCPRIH